MPNGVRRLVWKKRSRNFTAKNVVTAAQRPATSAGPRTPLPAEPSSSGSFSAAAAKITGVASRKPKRAASSFESPASRPPPIEKPEREMPGTSAAACEVPTAIAWRQLSFARRPSTSPGSRPGRGGRRRRRSNSSSSDTPLTIRKAAANCGEANSLRSGSSSSRPMTPTGIVPATSSQPSRA